jgi:phage repressor protein C with HTH and peptisase S24 domain
MALPPQEKYTTLDLAFDSSLRYRSGMNNLRHLRDLSGLSQLELADLAETSQPQIARLEDGSRKLTKQWAERLAPHLGVNAVDLLFGPPTAPTPASAIVGKTERQALPLVDYNDTMPVYASAEDGMGYLSISTDEIERVARPYTLEKIADAYAVLVSDDLMEPAYEPGDRAWVNPRLPPLRNTDCILYTGDAAGKKATIKRLVSWTETHWEVKQHNPAQTIKLDRKIWTKCHRIVGNFRRQ